jgi:formylmethanofuran dehydrogenase subunit D
MGINLKVVTFRDIFQYEAGKKSRFSSEFQNLSAQIIMDREDMSKLKVNGGQNVCLENDVGKVIVTARQTDDESHPGLGFMTNSPWSNQLVGAVSSGGVIPEFKAIAVLMSASNEEVTKLSELLERMRH